MKKIFILFVASLLLVSCGKKKFDKNLTKSYFEQVSLVTYSMLTCEKISDTWHNAIYNHIDPHGNYCNDFNEAVIIVMDAIEAAGISDSISIHKNAMMSYVSKMKNPPSSRKECYNDYVDLATETIALSDLALSPSGSLQSYNNRIEEVIDNIYRKLDLFKMKHGDYLKL